MEKRISEWQGKKVYLLGVDIYGSEVWWQKSGNVITFVNNLEPKDAGDDDYIADMDFNEVVWEEKFLYTINVSPLFSSTTTSDSEAWELAELIKRFYLMRSCYVLFNSGHAGMSRSECDSTNMELANQINNVELPKIINRIAEILTPEQG